MSPHSYRRDYVRPCRDCHRPIEGAARNQVLHPLCRKEGTARRHRLRHDCRRRPTGKTRARYYRWHTCETPGCGERFLAGHRARFCETCMRRRRRADAARRARVYELRHHPARAARVGIREQHRTLAPPAPPL